MITSGLTDEEESEVSEYTGEQYLHSVRCLIYLLTSLVLFREIDGV
jgi:hypothetical protein